MYCPLTPGVTYQDPPFWAVRVGALGVAAAAGLRLPRGPRGWLSVQRLQVPSVARAPPRPPIPSCGRAGLEPTAPGGAGAGSGAAARTPPASDGPLQPPPSCPLGLASTSATQKDGRAQMTPPATSRLRSPFPSARSGDSAGLFDHAQGRGRGAEREGLKRRARLWVLIRRSWDSNVHQSLLDSTLWLCSACSFYQFSRFIGGANAY